MDRNGTTVDRFIGVTQLIPIKWATGLFPSPKILNGVLSRAAAEEDVEPNWKAILKAKSAAQRGTAA